jgi:hypothetical protein
MSEAANGCSILNYKLVSNYREKNTLCNIIKTDELMFKGEQ